MSNEKFENYQTGNKNRPKGPLVTKKEDSPDPFEEEITVKESIDILAEDLPEFPFHFTVDRATNIRSIDGNVVGILPAIPNIHVAHGREGLKLKVVSSTGIEGYIDEQFATKK